MRGEMVRIAWHLGNRHLPAQLCDDRIRIRATMSSGTWWKGWAGTSSRSRRRSTRNPAPMPAGTTTTTMIERDSPICHGRRAGNLAFDARLLRLLAWLSPAFPTGGFAYSHGLEWAVECGDISDGDTLRAWLADVLTHGSGRDDAILLRHAHRAGERPCRAERPGSGRCAVARAAERDARPGHRLCRPPPPPGRCAPQLPRWTACAYPVAVGAIAATAWHRRGRRGGRLSPGLRHQPRSRPRVRLVPLGQTDGPASSSPRSSRSSCRSPANPRTATLDDLGGCALPLPTSPHAPRNPVHEAVPLMTPPATVRCASASAARSAPARPR